MPEWKCVAASSKRETISSYMLSRINTVGNDLWGQSFTNSERYFAAASSQQI